MRILITILLCFLYLGLLGQTGNKAMFMNTTVSAITSSGATGGTTAPTFVLQTETNWDNNTSPKTTGSLSVENGDFIIAFAVIEGQASATSDDITISGGGLTWTEKQAIRVTDYAYIIVFTTTSTLTTSITVSFTHAGALPNTDLLFGGSVFVFRDSNGIGNSAKTNVSSGAPSLSITTSQSNSALIVYSSDWNGGDGASRTWRTVNSITPSNANSLEKTYYRNASAYTVYGAYYNNAGTAGAKTVGLSAPSGQKYSIIAIEIKGL